MSHQAGLRLGIEENMMKKYLWVVALVVLSSLFAGSVAADSSHAQQDQAFLQQLAQPAKAPMTVFASPEQEQPPVAAPALCNQVSCTANFQCQTPCPGGGYCDRFLKKCNYI
jgi:hypothetical protein